MKKRISVIVPVYNSAPYLKGCVNSVLRQSYTDFELLLITDGPTDGSEEICRSLALKDQRIHFLPQPHKGVSAARNIGLEKAAGEYLFFLDSDDAIHPYLLEQLLKLAEKTGAAIMTEGFCALQSAYFEKRVSQLSSSDGQLFEGDCLYLDRRKALDYFLSDGPRGQLYAVGGKLIRRAAALAVRFDESMISGEDTKYMYQLLAKGADVALLNEDNYYYRGHKKSRSRERTVKTCKSIYACDKYIWSQEMAQGREMYAQRQEEKIMKKIAAWHVEGHMRGDAFLRQYTRELAEKEKSCLKAKQTAWRVKAECRLAFSCYPAYQFCHTALGFLRSIKKRR